MVFLVDFGRGHPSLFSSDNTFPRHSSEPSQQSHTLYQGNKNYQQLKIFLEDADKGLDRKKGTFDFSQTLIKTPLGDFKQVTEELYRSAGDLVNF